MYRKAYFVIFAAACLHCGDNAVDVDPGEADAGADILADGGDVSDPGNGTDAGATSDAGEATDTGAQADAGIVAPECEAVVEAFATLGSANPDLPEPMVSASCDGISVVVSSNSIPDFPYVETSPGNPRAFEADYTFPLVPMMANEVTEVPRLGALGVAVNGIPIFGQAEGTGGDVMSLGGGFTECGGHNGPTGYHYHTFDVTGSDRCRFSVEDLASGPVLYGYAFDGFKIYGSLDYTSSYMLTDPSLFATDTFSAHTYIEGSGDLDECNGRFDENGEYAYYTTETFPYTVGCYRGVPTENGGGGPGGGGGG